MSIYAVVKSGLVTNVIEWDGESEWTAPEGSQIVLIGANVEAGIGSSYDGSTFTAPAIPPSNPAT